MPVVHHTVYKSDGTTGKVSSVVINLVTGDLAPVAFRKDNHAGIDTSLTLKPNSETWSVNLTSNLDMSPDNSVYRVTEYMSDRRYPATWFISVPNGQGPYELTGILTTAPHGLPPAIVIGGGGSGEVDEQFVDDHIGVHVANLTPHPAYDDVPSFTVLFENGLV